MGKVTISKFVTRRQYSDLEKRATEYIETGDWRRFLGHIKHTNSTGKARDSVVSLLQLDVVGGTDSDVFKEFSSLEGTSLQQIRANARDHAISILKDQIEERHTYFLDVDAMALTPYAILVKDVIDARKRELAELEGSPSRIEVLGTFYGFTILMIEGSKPHENTSNYGYYRWRRRTWLDEKITESAANAVKQLTGEFAEAVDMDQRYRTLGSSPIFKSRCTKTTADILANAVRLALYKVPGYRSRAARALGRTEDSRTLPFLHHRLTVEESRNVRISIAEALGKVGHESSIDVLKERAELQGRYLTKEGEAAVSAIGGIYAPQCRETLVNLLKVGRNEVKAASIYALAKQEQTGLVGLISPYLVDKSRPVVRASVMALMDLGRQGQAAIKEKIPVVIKRIGYDKPSRTALTKMLSISGVGEMELVQQYFATRITKLGNAVRRWQGSSSRGSYSYYWKRRERRERQRLLDYLKLASTYLKPPFDDELLKSIKTILQKDTDLSLGTSVLGQSELAKAIEPKKPWYQSYTQTYLMRGS